MFFLAQNRGRVFDACAQRCGPIRSPAADSGCLKGSRRLACGQEAGKQLNNCKGLTSSKAESVCTSPIAEACLWDQSHWLGVPCSFL